ncbi:MAG TPA: NUDIX hydrolase [Candidatus Saccharimonadales bacterium]|nr:NUDIX hydrolase [Candidatus Saccharimonadales bacterium]
MAVQTFQVGIKALIRNDDGNILMVHIPEWSGNPAHWDLPGGRIDGGESFDETLRRELKEEIGVDYSGKPKLLTTLLTKITIPIGDTRLPLVFVIYEVKLPSSTVVKLDPESAEDDFRWFKPTESADEMATKFTSEFCEMIRALT